METHTSPPASEDRQAIREAVRSLCKDFPDPYWRAVDKEERYPEEFVTALTKSGYLAALIPEEDGGGGAWASPSPASFSKRSITPAGPPAPAMPRCTPWAQCCGTAAMNKNAATCQPSPRANCGCRHLPSRS